MTAKTITLNEQVVPKMTEYVAKINARAFKIGQAMLTVIETGREVVEQEDGSFEVMVTFEISGDTPKINGWTFVARIEHDPDLGHNVLRVAPGQSLPRRYWEAPCNCDHCGTKRVRRDTFILREESTGEYKQIGRQCVRDFIGYDNPADMYWWLGVVDGFASEADGWNGEMRSNPLYRTKTILEYAIASTNLYGYRSRRMVDDGKATVATSSYVYDMYCRFPNGTPAHVTAIRAEASTAAVAAAADAVLNWIKGWDDATKEKSEFNFNVSKMIAGEFCRGRDFGLISCLNTMYLKEMSLLEERVARSNLHIGEVGQKIELRVTIKTVYAMQGFYGTTHLVLMEDEVGNMLKWIASNFGDFEKGDVVTVKGTIKAHDEYKGRNQTVLTRCKLAAVKE